MTFLTGAGTRHEPLRMSAWEATDFGNGRNCDKLAFYTKNWLKSISTSNAPHFPNKVYNMHAWFFFSQSERLKRRKVNTSTILTTRSLKWRWYHLSTIISVLSVTISLQIIFALIAFYAYGLCLRNDVTMWCVSISCFFKIVRNFDGSTSEPAMRSCDTGQRIPCFDNISVVRKTDGQGYGQVTIQI